jgi:leucyl/phenylalanyl-tRNA---protein transferase
MSLEYQFPDPRSADSDGLLAAGGDLSIQSLIAAYSNGIFPWFDENSPILWWSPDPRLILIPSRFKISASLQNRLRSGRFEVRTDRDFASVIAHCARVKRKGQAGTWITTDMINAYTALHEEGIAHSFETYHNGILVGGLYGVSLGSAFFGESMYYEMTDASKIALCGLVEWAMNHDFHFIDAQQSTSHLKSMGAEEVERDVFLKLLAKALKFPTLKGNWE